MSMVKMMLGDSMQIMEVLHCNFDMIFLDPQYFEWENSVGTKPSHNKLSALAYELLKPRGCVFLCGTQPQMTKDWHYWARFFNINFELIPHKHAGTPAISTKRPILVHENIWCLYRKRDKLANIKLDMSRVTKKGKKITATKRLHRMKTRYGKEWFEWRKDVGYPKSVQKVKRIDSSSKEYEGHPAQKPLKLTRLIVKISTHKGDWILDPFAGVGTTPVACRELNRNCLAIEINPLYARLYRRRLQRAKDLKKLERWMK